MSSEMLELCHIINQHMMTQEDFTQEIQPGIRLVRLTTTLSRAAVVYQTGLCILVQGSKRAHFDGQTHHYHPGRFLVSTLSVPVDSEVITASEERPLLGLIMDLHPHHLSQILVELEDDVVDSAPHAHSAISTYPIDRSLAQTLLRLLRAALHDTAWRILGDGLLREWYFYLLMGPARGVLCSRVVQSSDMSQIARAVDYIERHLIQPLDVTAIARAAGMSPSNLHSKFKKVTAQSPMQFVKRLRLHQARLLILSGHSVTEAAVKVGYVSLSQFSREFSRHYGLPPSKMDKQRATTPL